MLICEFCVLVFIYCVRRAWEQAIEIYFNDLKAVLHAGTSDF